ncbi:MAG TPA: ABC transporter ATP-binding protein [Nitrososphaerales archaeon]|nr:ABC transporter ATP-binding protein [Nitrososphaerales archaeon]
MSLPTSDEPVVELQNLGKTFSAFRAIDGVNLKIGRGEVFGLLGPNGAGKTTTMRIIACLLSPTDGDVFVDGKSVRDPKNRTTISRSIGLLTESPNVYERLTAEQNLVFFARAYGVPEKEIEGRVRAVLREFDLEERRGDRAVTLSKGMRQKLAIARALVHQPSILLLDEPTASLDAESARMIRSQISETTRTGGHTVLLSTHNLNDASRLCDRIAFISRGRILAIGSEQEVSSQVKKEHPNTTADRITVTMISFEGFSDERLANLITGTKSVHRNGDGRSFELIFRDEYSPDDIEVLTSKAIASLVGAGAQITSVVQSKPSLEDLYLDIVTGARKEN